MWLCQGTLVIFRRELNWDIVVQQLGSSEEIKATHTNIPPFGDTIHTSPKHVFNFAKILLAASHIPR
jgi:hypothetical protein